ncbi:hypothetical protein [Pseudoxanthomonas sp. JBR18]|uniref:hypothetical protein n=1 Tax=Pseudoxanthomonas sp. JBR18 TaxID=2969308 RepID=UPI002304D1B9|nr:hypothetical protein [Pseudoxanthomonas sp. JBR18]WCE02840.1 hypothetical protein PJ250_11875 [Pseudoxanthomonas sp. JBR18]
MPSTSAPRFPPLTALFLFLLLGLLQTMTWMGLSVYLGGQCSWMALVLGLTSALALRLGGMPAGGARMLWAAALTALGAVWASWGIVVLQMAISMGVRPDESALKLGGHLAWTLIQLANRPLDWLLLAAGVIGAAIASR